MMSTQERADNVSQSIDSAVKRYCEDRGRSDTRTKGDGFTIWCLTDLFGFERDTAIDAIFDGPNDRSIDAVADDGNRLIVIQGKYNSHDWAEITKFREDTGAVRSGQATALPARLKAAAAKIRSQRYAGLPTECFYITNQKFSGGVESRLGSLTGDPVVEALDLDGICDRLAERESERPLNAPAKPVQLQAAAGMLAFEDSLILPVSLLEFARFVGSGEKWLFNSNVRQYLAKSRINIGIRKTVQEAPSHFWRYNNGVTMVVDDFAISEQDGTVQLVKPQIVNGCQTSLAITRMIDQMDSRERVGLGGSVLIRIIKEPSDEERRRITQFTNKQNAVRGKDFFALKDFQQLLKGRIDALGYFYEIQTGSFDMQSRSVKEKLKGDARFAHLGWTRRDYRIPAIEAAKCHAAAMKGRVAVCYANPGDLAPEGELYDTVFPADLPEAPELFLLPFLLMKHVEHELGYGTPKGEAWRRRGRYMFVFSAFRTLGEALGRAGRLPEGGQLSPANVSIVREVMSREDVVKTLVAVTERVMEGFFSDSATEKLVNDDIFSFLKGPVEKKEATEVLELKVRRAVSSPLGQQLVEQLKETIPA